MVSPRSAKLDSLGMDYEGDAHITGAGEGEGFDSYTASGISLSFGDLIFHDQNAVITGKASDHTNTTIGLPLLRRFNLVFDYFHEELSLEPNGHGS